MSTINWVEFSAIAIAVIVAAIMIILLRRGLITESTVTTTGNLLDSLPVFSEDGFVGQLFNYCRLAVRAVEQMTKSGVLPKDDVLRKDEAIAQVLDYAKIDGLELGEKDKEAINALIEAAVLELPKTGG